MRLVVGGGSWLLLRLQLSLRPVTTMPDFDLPLTLTTHHSLLAY